MPADGSERISFRPLALDDLRLVQRWLAEPHVARWWRSSATEEHVRAEYEPCIAGTDPTEVFVIELDEAPIGLIQRYLLADYPDWARALGIAEGAGIDYLIGEGRFTGTGIGTRCIRAFTQHVFERYPEAPLVTADPQQDNAASWRALEKAGFERVFAGQLESDHPSDSGPRVRLRNEAAGARMEA